MSLTSFYTQPLPCLPKVRILLSQPNHQHPNFLDQAFAHLLVKICANQDINLTEQQQHWLEVLARHCSHSTRQGMIAAPLPLDLGIDELEQLYLLPVIGQPGDYKPLIIEYRRIWLNRYWQYEQRLAQNLKLRLHRLPLKAEQADSLKQVLDTWFTHPDTALQKQAIERATTTPFLIISGGPGTGKTTTVTRLLCALIEQLAIAPERIRLAAPTGKAAMRMQEAIRHAKQQLQLAPELAVRIPEQGSTLHRLLGYIPGRIGFRHHSLHPIPADVVIVDEASMIDISLMTHLCEAVSPQARLILLGDKDQLASVETGSIFRDLCTPPTQTPHPLDQHIIVLQKSWRFASDSGIGQLAAAVRDRQEQVLLALLKQQPAGVTWTEQVQLSSQVLQSAWHDYLVALQHWSTHGATPAALEQSLAALFKAFNDFRVLTPLRKGLLGTERLNHTIAKLIAPALPEGKMSVWYAGRPVMVTENDYRQQLFNGDIGITLPKAEGGLEVWFNDVQRGGFRAIAPVRLPNHETAWAMTIHKSQGSEFDKILLLLPEQTDTPILVRELLYTGITRARSEIRIMGKQSVLLAALKRDLPDASCTRQRLDEMLQIIIDDGELQ